MMLLILVMLSIAIWVFSTTLAITTILALQPKIHLYGQIYQTNARKAKPAQAQCQPPRSARTPCHAMIRVIIVSYIRSCSTSGGCVLDNLGWLGASSNNAVAMFVFDDFTLGFLLSTLPNLNLATTSDDTNAHRRK